MSSKKGLLTLLFLVGATSAVLAQDYYTPYYGGAYGYRAPFYGRYYDSAPGYGAGRGYRAWPYVPGDEPPQVVQPSPRQGVESQR
jgi:hypothetical protein